MAKITINFNFVPFPAEVWDQEIALSLAEFRFLGYLCKQIRFGEALPVITDDEMMHGIFEDGRRRDKGCGLSRNGVKQAREALVEREWIEAENVSNDPSRPKWNYRLLLEKKGERGTVTARQEVSQRDTGTGRHKVSGHDSAVSQPDTGTVTARQGVSRGDTCNKEEESTKYINKTQEKTDAPLSPNVLLIAQQRFMERLADEPAMVLARFAREENPRRALFVHVRMSAKNTGLSYGQAKDFLSDHPTWREWEDLEQLDSQQEIQFPAREYPEPQPISPEHWEAKAKHYEAAKEVALEYIALREAGKPIDDAWVRLGRKLGTLNANEIHRFLDGLQEQPA